MKSLFCFFVLSILLSLSLHAQQLGGSVSRTNTTTAADLPDQPAIKWQFKTGGAVVGSPVVSGHILFIGSADSCMYAIDKNSGAPLWKYRTNGPLTATVACDSNAVFFMSGDGYFYALDKLNGRLLWTFKTNGEHATDPWDYYLSSAALHKGVIYVGSTDGHIYALDAHNGKLRWKFRTGGAVHAAPTIAEDIILAGSFDGWFYALNSNGSLRWKFDTMGERYFPLGEVQFHAVVADSSVYFCSRDYNVYALHLRTGKGLWVFHEGGSWTSVPSLAGKRLLVSTSDTHRALAFNASSGGLQWNSPVGLNVFGSITTSANYGYMGCLDGKVHKINLETGESVALFQTAASKAEAHRFYDPATQKLLPDLMERYKGDYIRMYHDFLDMGSILSTPWLETGTLYFGSTDGNVYALQ